MFKSKTAQIAGLVLAVILFCIPVGMSIYDAQADVPYVPAVETTDIIGPQSARVGELVRLSVDADSVEWKSLPENPNVQVYGDRNENMVVSFETPGMYTVIAGIVKNGDLKVSILQINVGGVPQVTAPAPVQPVQPGVQPAPAPTAGLAANVTQWCTAGGVDKAVAKQMASNFSTVAKEISLAQLKDAEAIIARTAQLNSTLTLDGYETVMGQLQAHLTSQADAGNLSTPQQHTVVWEQIAAGLNAYAK